MLTQWIIRARALLRPHGADAEFDEEVKYHVDREVDRLIANGMSPEEARYAAHRGFGNATTIREDARTTWRWQLVDELGQDVAYALRILRRAPGFTAVVIITLALGIGANTAVFSVVRSVLLRPLPFPADERLAVVRHPAARLNTENFLASPPEYVEYRDQARSWEHLAAYRISSVTATGDGAAAERIDVSYATAQLFPTLGVSPLVGRWFTTEEDDSGRDDVVVLSHGFWVSRFGGNPAIIGRPILFDGRARVVVGVMPPGFAFPSANVRAWLPASIMPADLPRRGSHNIAVVGRLRPGVTLAGAAAELNDLTARLTSAGIAAHTWHPPAVVSLREELVGDVSRTLWVMLGAAALVLVIACANVANLLLVRAGERAREMSLRTALGAGRRRLVAQLLTESVVLAGAGGLAGVALAYLGVDALRAAAPADLPRLDSLAVDGSVLLFTLVLTAGAGIVFGLLPAMQAGRANLQGMLREEGRGGTAGRKRMRLRQVLVVSETALAVVLLVSAGLLLQSFRRLLAVDPGYRTDGVVTFTLTTPEQGHPEGADVVRYFDNVRSRLTELPGVATVGAAKVVPLSGALFPGDIEIEGVALPDSGAGPVADLQAVTPGYFAAMGIPLTEGRGFDERDRTDAPLVAVVSEALAREYWPGRSAIGEGVRHWGRDPRYMRVVGVVPDVRQDGLDHAPDRGTLYTVHAQTPFTWTTLRSMMFTVRTTMDPSSLVGSIRQAVQAIDPSVPLYQVRTLQQAVTDTTATRRFAMLLQLLFALVALTLSAVGLYGVLAFTVTRRTAEIGIRMALGATRGEIRGMVVRQGMKLMLVALAVGVLFALATGRLIGALLFGVSAADPFTYSVVVGVLLGVAILACWIPANRASGVDPTEALRSD